MTLDFTADQPGLSYFYCHNIQEVSWLGFDCSLGRPVDSARVTAL
jgi:hypothetical protein